MNDMDRQAPVQNLMKNSNFTLSSRPERIKAFINRNRQSIENTSRDAERINDVNQDQFQNRLNMRNSNTKKFEHNLLLPAKNPRELTKVINFDRNKWVSPIQLNFF